MGPPKRSKAGRSAWREHQRRMIPGVVIQGRLHGLPRLRRRRVAPGREGLFRCEGCEGSLGGEMLGTLVQIAVLTEMGLLPDGTSHCLSCGSEVQPAGSSAAPCATTEAYLCGWEDGLFGEAGSFARNRSLPRFGAP